MNVVPKIPHAECEFSKGLFSVFRSVLAHNLERLSVFSQQDFNQTPSERSVQILTVSFSGPRLCHKLAGNLRSASNESSVVKRLSNAEYPETFNGFPEEDHCCHL